jgi:DNA repair protein RadC
MYEIPIYKVALVREGVQEAPERVISSPQTAATVLRKYLDGCDREHLVVLLINKKNHLIGINTVSIGSLDSSLAHPREVFKPAIIGNAAGIILGHNHPSGDPEPSQADRTLTCRLHDVGEIIGIELVDHIIVGGNSDNYTSFRELGLIAKEAHSGGDS